MEASASQLLAKFAAARALFERVAAAAAASAGGAGRGREGGAAGAPGEQAAPLRGAPLLARLARVAATEVAALELKYALSTSRLHAAAAGNPAEAANAAAEHARILAAENFAGDVDRLVGRVEAALLDAGVALRCGAAATAAAVAAAAAGGGAAAGAEGGGAAAAAAPARRGGRGGGRGGGAAVAVAAQTPPPGGQVLLRAATASAGPAPVRFSAAATAELQRLLDVYPRPAEAAGGRGDRGLAVSAAGAPTPIAFDRCDACGAETTVDTARSELRCRSEDCGAVKTLVGAVFDDSQFYSQEGQKAKSGTFHPNRHFQYWWTHLLAREPEEELGDKDDPDNQYGEKLLENLRTIVARDRLTLQMLDVLDIRKMLIELGKTHLNKNVPLILKKLTGRGPPVVPDAKSILVENIFTRVIEIAERLRGSENSNRHYYPYYIQRIWEAKTPESDYEQRRLLYYIYVQGADTVIAADNDWRVICQDDLVDIEYTPMDRHIAKKYPPV